MRIVPITAANGSTDSTTEVVKHIPMTQYHSAHETSTTTLTSAEIIGIVACVLGYCNAASVKGRSKQWGVGKQVYKEIHSSGPKECRKLKCA